MNKRKFKSLSLAISIVSLLFIRITPVKGETFRSESYVKNGTYVTPHFRWALPYEGVPLKVLFISPEPGSRDIWDLAQRIPIEHTVFEIETARGRFGSPDMFATDPEIYEQRRSELNAILDKNRFDLIVLGNVAWSSLPMDIVYKITAQATRGGAGVVLANADFQDPMLETLYTREPLGDGLEILQPFPFEALERGLSDLEFQKIKGNRSPVAMLGETVPYHQPGDRKFDLKGKITGYRLKKGRFISLHLPFAYGGWGGWSCVSSLIPGIPVNMRNLWQEEYHYMLVAKAFLWAAGRTPSARLTKILPMNSVQSTGELLKVDVGVALSEKSRAGSPETPFLLAADSFIHVRLYRRVRRGLLRTEEAVVDFGTGFVRAAKEIPIKISLDKNTCEFPEPVTVKAEMPKDSEIDLLHVELYDSRGRIWEQKRIAVRDMEKISISMPTARTNIIAHGVRVTAYSGNRPVDTKDAFFTIRRDKPPESYYVSVSDSTWATWHQLRRYERAYEWGAEGLRNHAASIASAVTSAVAGLDTNPSHSPRIPHTLALNPEQTANLYETGRANSMIYRYFNQHWYDTADDAGPVVSPVYEPAIPQFREWIKKESGGDIKVLNNQWGTSLGSFEEISADFLNGSKRKGLVPVWVDYCRFVHERYMEAHKLLRSGIRSADPTAGLGVDSTYYNHSLASMYRDFNYIMPYYRPTAVEMGRLLSKAEPAYTGVCMGYGTHTPRPFHRYLPWHILLAGNNSILYWSLSAGLYGDLVYGDTPGGYRPGWMMEEVANIKLTGAGRFINSCERVSSGIDILYSQASRRAQDVDAPFSKLQNFVDPAALGFQEMLSDHGLSYNYISSESITEDGVLEKGDTKLLILPHVQSMSPAEAAKIRAFVNRGGTLLADVRPAIRTERGKHLGKGYLDDVFGIKRGKDAAVDTQILFPGTDISVPVRADAAVMSAGAISLLQAGNIPLFLENTYGRGKTVPF